MSTKKTRNYALHSWVKDDTFLMDEMNENFAKLDGKLKEEIAVLDSLLKAEVSARTQQMAAKADKTEVAEIKTTVETKENKSTVSDLDKKLQDLDSRKVQMVTGTYKGQGGTNTTTVNLGLKPQAVFVIYESGPAGYSTSLTYGYAIQECPLGAALVLNETGFSVINANSCMLNDKLTYLYIALC